MADPADHGQPMDELRWQLNTTANPARRRITQPPTFTTGHGRRRPQPTSHERSDPMLVAARSFTVEYYGARVEIRAGQDHVCASHWIARQYPDAFRMEDA